MALGKEMSTRSNIPTSYHNEQSKAVCHLVLHALMKSYQSNWSTLSAKQMKSLTYPILKDSQISLPLSRSTAGNVSKGIAVKLRFAYNEVLIPNVWYKSSAFSKTNYRNAIIVIVYNLPKYFDIFPQIVCFPPFAYL